MIGRGVWGGGSRATAFTLVLLVASMTLVPGGGGWAAELPEPPCSIGARAVAGGNNHGLLLDGDGRVWATGSNSQGQLGVGGSVSSTLSPLQVAVDDKATVVGIEAGQDVSSAITAEGALLVWGRHRLGGSTASSDVPLEVEGLPPVRQLAVGGLHLLALSESGTVWAWGANFSGQLGDGSTSTSTVPKQVVGLTDVVAVAAGFEHSLAVRADGTVWAWGFNQFGQLGNGTSGFGSNSSVPVQVSSLSSAVEVAAGGDHSLALLDNGAVRSWGRNNQGQLGNGTIDSRNTPGAVSGVSGVTMLAADASGNHSFALQDDKRVLGWGRNVEGQLGLGYSSAREVTPQLNGLSNVAVMSSGANYMRAVTANGDHYAWGDNGSGQLGDGTTTVRRSARQIGSVSYDLPSAPSELAAFPGESLAYLTWDSPDTGVVTGYVAIPAVDGAETLDAVPVSAAETETTISPLHEGTSYRFEVAAQNCLGTGGSSQRSDPVVPTGLRLGMSDSPSETLRITDRMSMEVNTFNGNAQLQVTDLTIKGTGLDLEVSRTYNARLDSDEGFGRGWTSTLAPDVQSEVLDSGVVRVRQPNGATTSFAPDGEGGYVTPPGVHSDLEALAGGGYELTERQSDRRWQFDEAGYLVEIADRNDNNVTYQRHSDGRLQAIVDTRGRALQVAYGGTRVSSLTDAAGRQYQYRYTGDLLTSVVDPSGAETRLEYTNDRLRHVITPEGRVVRLSYDGSGRLASHAWPLAAGEPTVTFTYDGHTTTVTDPRGNETVYDFDPVGRVTGVTDALGNATSTEYTATSNIRSFRTRRGTTTELSYANATSVASVTVPTGANTQSRYDDPRHPYLPTRMTDAQGNHLFYTYDQAGNVTSQRSELPSNNTVSLDIRPDGTRSQETDGRGVTTGYSYDAQAQLTGITPPAPLGEISLEYDVLSRVSAITDGNERRTTYTYDELDRLTGVTHADGTQVDYVYDRDGNLVSQTDEQGTTSMVYDARNQLIERTTPDGLTVVYGYDAAGNLTSITDRGGQVAYGYNAVNLPVEVIDRDGQTITMTYDVNYNRTAVTYPNGVSVTRGYDDSDRLEQVLAEAGNNELDEHAYSYRKPTSGDPDTHLRWSHTDVDGLTTDYQYDQLNRLTRARTLGTDGQVAWQHSYTYDAASNRLSRERIGDGPTFTDNYRYNDANQIEEVNGETFTHDRAGNLTSSSLGATYTYNAADQTTAIIPRADTGILATFAYRGLGQAERTGIGLIPDLTDLEELCLALPECVEIPDLLDLDEICLALLGCSDAPDIEVETTTFDHTSVGVTNVNIAGLDHHYTRAPDGTLLATHADQGSFYYLHDGLGSTTGLVDADGELAAAYRYSPFGETTVETGHEIFSPWRFTGAYHDPTGLYKIGERYYDPTLGRWTQQDPYVDALDPKQWNRYIYVGQDPINYTDPTGMCSAQVYFGVAETLAWGAVFGLALWAMPVTAFVGVGSFLMYSAYTGLAPATGAMFISAIQTGNSYSRDCIGR
jgi:RHS repeat-associated protein